MTEPATHPFDETRTGLDALAAIVTADRAGRDLWDLLHAAYPRAAATLAGPAGVLAVHTRARADLDQQQRARLARTRRRSALDLLEDVGRAMMTSPATLSAMAAGIDRPIPTRARPALAAAARRRLTILGLLSDDLTVRRVTNATVDALAGALAHQPA